MSHREFEKRDCQARERGIDRGLVRKTHHWLFSEALQLWKDHGIDPVQGGCVEALTHAGLPLRELPRRIRIHPRQCYVYARAAKYYPDRFLPLAEDLFRFTMACFDPQTGRLASVTSPDGEVLEAKHELYDLAFVLLAASAICEAGIDINSDLLFLKDRLDDLKAPRGWFENPARSLPRRQNPHMHLFEASLELYAATGDKTWKAVADECLELFRDVFSAPDGSVREYFDDTWRPMDPVQRYEPGHSAEWIWLLDRYEVVTGEASGGNFAGMFQYLLSAGNFGHLLPDCTAPNEPTSRLWPQTEFLKAVLSLRHHGMVHPACTPEHVLDLIFENYLTTPVPGGWFDRRSPTGDLLSDTMPASSLYHLFSGFVFYLEERGALGAKPATAAASTDRPKAAEKSTKERKVMPPEVESRTSGNGG